MQKIIEESFKEIGDWSSKIAIHPINTVPISCNDIVNIDIKSINLMTLEDLECLISKIMSYNIYVKSQKGSIEAQIEILSSEINKNLYLEVNNLGSDYKYKSVDEKISIVRTIKQEIDHHMRKLSVLRAQLARIKDVPFSIDKKIDILKMIYGKRLENDRAAKYKQ